MPKVGPLKGTDAEIFFTAFGPAMGWKGKQESMLPMQYALGSERFGFTFIYLDSDRDIIEFRESFYPPSGTWAQTPGNGFMATEAIGQKHEGVAALRCLSCHVTALPNKGITPEPRFFGVGCESCHGSGKKHVEAVKTGEKNISMPKLTSLGAKQLNELCGRCHRTEKDLAPSDMQMTQRFAPYGLMKSRCFLESGNTLSCLTCHDPHKDASPNEKEYERACLKCHSPSQSAGPSHSKQKVCKVNPSSGCIPCHMPKTRPSPDVPFKMSDHYIRVFSEEEKTKQELQDEMQMLNQSR